MRPTVPLCDVGLTDAFLDPMYFLAGVSVILDADYQPKPAYQAMYDLLK
jgi:hypothetical protein